MNLETAYLSSLRPMRAARVRELPGSDDELAWQARWFSGACGREFTSESGQPVRILDFGQWNNEAGPDFTGATVNVAGEERRGDIEIDLDASAWEQHGHAENPSFADTVLHVVVRSSSKRRFSRNSDNRDVPQICLRDAALQPPEWDASAVARPGKCCAPLRGIAPPHIEELLAVAAKRRLEHKAGTLAAMIAARGKEHAIYESLAIALGYKSNKLPFQLLAQKVPRRTAATSRGEALLFGLAGFLEKPQPPSPEAREQLASLWQTWWKLRATSAASILPRRAWKLSGIRPANAPVRRIAALSAIARHWRPVGRAIESADLAAIEKSLASLVHPFWSFHTSWGSPRRQAPLALVGHDRALAIFANVALPLAVAEGRAPAWHHVRAEAAGKTLRIVASRLFGGPLPPAVPRRLYAHQGLLQIYEDFCQRASPECEGCGFPALARRLAT